MRPLSTAAKQAIFAPETGQAFLFLLTIKGPESYADRVLTSGPAAYWRLGEAVGQTTARDLIGERHGAISGGVTLGIDNGMADDDRAMSFDGSTGLISVADHSVFNVNQFSVEFLIKATVPQPVWAWARSISKNNADISVPGWEFQVVNQTIDLHLRYDTSTAVAQVKTIPGVIDGVRHHIVGVVDGLGGTIHTYRDGTQAMIEAPGMTGGPGAFTGNTQPLVFGRASRAAVEFFQGIVDEVAFYDRLLTPAEIGAHVAALSLPTIPTIRVVNDVQDLISRGHTFIGLPFQIALPEDREDQLPQVTLAIDNIDRQVVQAIRTLTTPPTITLEVVLASNPDVLEAGPFNLTLRDTRYDAIIVSGILQYEDILSEPFPQHSFTPNLFPGAFAA